MDCVTQAGKMFDTGTPGCVIQCELIVPVSVLLLRVCAGMVVARQQEFGGVESCIGSFGTSQVVGVLAPLRPAPQRRAFPLAVRAPAAPDRRKWQRKNRYEWSFV